MSDLNRQIGVVKHTIEIEENLLVLMIDSTIKRLKNAIDKDDGKNKNHTENLMKNYQKMLNLLEAIKQ